MTICEGCGGDASLAFWRDQFPLCYECRKARRWRGCKLCNEPLPPEELKDGSCADCLETRQFIHQAHAGEGREKHSEVESRIRKYSVRAVGGGSVFVGET